MRELFPPEPGPRVFALPPGVDFIGAVARGLADRLGDAPPEAMADVTVLLNTRRAARALEARLAEGKARLLPRIGTVADLADDPLLAPSGLAPAEPPLRRRLRLARLVREFLRATGQAPEPASFALAESLAALMDELAGSGIAPARLRTLDAGSHAAHWQRALAFLDIAAGAGDDPAAGGEGRLRAAALALAARWVAAPPERPVIVAGSTGSRAPTRILMAAIARLPQGAVILPGLDEGLPRPVWDRLDADAPGACDHPQHAFRALGHALGFDPAAVPLWSDEAAPDRRRNALVALALRPAPVTDQWRAEAPAHAATVRAATAGLALIEAPSPRGEADAIALALREAAAEGRSAALVTPDRTLARRVAARLARWGIVPDDSAGRPLALTPPGIFLSLLAAHPAGRLPATALLALLKHPLTNAAARGAHLRLVQRLETDERGLAGHPPLVDWPSLARWAEAAGPEAEAWLGHLRGVLAAPLPEGAQPLAALVAAHRAAAEALSAGASGEALSAGVAEGGAAALWDKAAGAAARALLAEIEAAGDAAGAVEAAEYRALLAGLMNAASVPEEAAVTHGGIAILGTLEARARTADRLVLGGLNEGTWPGPAPPDPWLSRPLRRDLGLPSPETLIGLSAHDFTLAAAAPEAILARAVRDEEAPTVPSRWLLRLENLLRGIGPEGAAALEGMRARGAVFTDLARRLDRPEAEAAPEPRPAPIPPAAARPARLSVTQLETLVRDPYAIYARHVLGLKPLPAPGRSADALARGTALHAVMERFGAATEAGLPADAEALLMRIADAVLAEQVPWAAARAIWRARLARLAPWVVAGEAERRSFAAPLAREVRGGLDLGVPAFRITAIADRIDRGAAGALAIYDYKSGRLPSEKELAAFHLQLFLEAAIARTGGFDGVPAAPAARLELVGLARGETRALDPDATDAVLTRLAGLLAVYAEGEAGFTARLRPQRIVFAGDYDHLSRRGEWADGDPAAPRAVP